MLDARPGASTIDTQPTDRWQLYERTVQAPELCVEHLCALHGKDPRVLGEDFAGSAALSRAWIRALPGGRAIAVDHDAQALERAREEAEHAGWSVGIESSPRAGHRRQVEVPPRAGHAPHHDSRARLELLEGDVRTASDPRRHRADLVFAGNFSIGELATRAELCDYLRHARARLSSGGAFVCDTYAGAAAWRTGAVERSRFLADGTRLRWTWEQRSADPASARVVVVIHFRVERAGVVVRELPEAFVYRWRLWSPPELQEALQATGFARAEVRTSLGDDACPRIEGDLLFVACVVGRTRA